MLDVGGRGGELRNDVVLGGTNFLSTELYQPLGPAASSSHPELSL